MNIKTMKLALEALHATLATHDSWEAVCDLKDEAITALRQAIEQSTEQVPEFTKHTVESTADWSEWVCPDPESYLMKCCDCGLVHEAQFGVVRYKSETEREDCDTVDDPNLQAVFRMRRHEAWEPEDTAHRVGGLPQSTEQEPVAWMHWLHGPVRLFLNKDEATMELDRLNREYPVDADGRKMRPLVFGDTSPPQRQPLTDEQIKAALSDMSALQMPFNKLIPAIARAIEAAHGIKGEA